MAMARLSNGQAPKRLDGAKKGQGACQDLISWEDSGPAVLDLGLLLLASYSEVAERTGPLAGRVPSEKGPRRRTTKRLGPSRAISLGSEVLHKGRADCEGWQRKQGRAWQSYARDKVRSAGIIHVGAKRRNTDGAQLSFIKPRCAIRTDLAQLGQAGSQHRRLMIAICRDPWGLSKMTDGVSWCPVLPSGPGPGDIKGLSAESQGSGEVEAGAGR